MNWMSLLGLDAVRGRWHSAITEGMTALGDRVALAKLEWHAQQRRLLHAFLLALIVAAFMVVALLLVSLAVLTHFWDTPQRLASVWSLAAFWLLACTVALSALLRALRGLRHGFDLTYRELAKDWQDLKERQ